MRSNWWQRIQEEGRKVKVYVGGFASSDIFIVVLVILVGLAAFGLGRLSALEKQRPAIQIAEAKTSTEKPIRIGGQLVASRNGNKYHFPWCAGDRAMNQGNKIWFAVILIINSFGIIPILYLFIFYFGDFLNYS